MEVATRGALPRLRGRGEQGADAILAPARPTECISQLRSDP